MTIISEKWLRKFFYLLIIYDDEKNDYEPFLSNFLVFFNFKKNDYNFFLYIVFYLDVIIDLLLIINISIYNIKSIRII